MPSEKALNIMSSVCKEAAFYYQQLKSTPSVLRTESKKSLLLDQFKNYHATINDGFARPLATKRKERLILRPILKMEDNDEYKIPPEDDNDNPFKNEYERVPGIDIARTERFFLPESQYNPSPLDSLIKFTKDFPKSNYSVNLPADYELLDFIQITASSIKPLAAQSDETFSGFFQLFYISKTEPASEPLYFTINPNFSVKFTQSTGLNLFLINHPSEDLYIACFLEKTKTGSSLRYKYACSAARLFNSTKELSFSSFSEEWSTFKSFDSISCQYFNVLMDDSQGHTQVITDIKIRKYDIYSEGKNQEFTFSSNGNPSRNLIALPIPPRIDYPSPFVTISNFHFTLNKPPKNSEIYFKAIVLDEPVKKFVEKKLPTGKNVFPGPDCKLQAEYISSSFSTIGLAYIPDTIRIFITPDIKPNSHVVIFLMGRDNKKGKESVYKVGIIPLRNNDDQINRTQKLILYDIGKVPGKYLDNPKKPNKTHLICNVHLPQAFFPTPSVRKIINSGSFDIQNQIGPKEQLAEILIPMTYKLISIPSINNIFVLFKLWDNFEQDFLRETLVNWIYNTYDPTFIDISHFCFVLVEYINKSSDNLRETSKELKRKESQKLKKKDKKKSGVHEDSVKQQLTADNHLNLLFKYLSYVFDFIISSINSSQAPNIDHSPLVKLLSNFGNIICELDAINDLETGFSLSSKFGDTLYLTQHFFTINEMASIFFSFLSSTSSIKDDNQIVKPDVIKLQLNVFRALMISPDFIIGLSSLTKLLIINTAFSPFNKVLSLLYNVISCSLFGQYFNPEDPATQGIINQLCGILARFAPELESIKNEDVLNHVCYCLFPLVDILSQYYHNFANYETQVSIIPFTLTVLNKLDTNYIKAYFHSLSTIIKNSYLEFFTKMVSFVSEKCEIGKRQFFIQISRHIIHFLLEVTDELGSTSDQFISFVEHLTYNQLQSLSNYIPIYNLILRAIQCYKCEKELVRSLLQNVRSQVHSLRCMSAALLCKQIVNDFERNGDIVLSSVYMMESLTKILLEGEQGQVEIYKVLINVIQEIIKGFKAQELEKLVLERMQSTLVIADAVFSLKNPEYPPEIRCQQAMRIADQYKKFPSMRHTWLAYVLQENRNANDHVSAFVTQMHIVALASTVFNFNVLRGYQQKLIPLNEDPPFHLSIVQPISNSYPVYRYKHSQDYINFMFMPETALETEIPIDSFSPAAMELIRIFDFRMLMNEIDTAINICENAHLFYSLRPLISMKLRLYYLIRNFEGTCNTCKQLFVNLDHVKVKTCTMTHDISLKFYLVERNVKKEISRTVYCVDQLNAEQFIEQIETKQRFGSTKLKLCNDHSSNCSKHNKEKYGCVIEIEPTDNIPIDGEDPHCWQKFQLCVTPKMIENCKDGNSTISVVTVQTNNSIPSYKVSTDVINYEIIEKPVTAVIEEKAIYLGATFDMLADNLEVWYESQDSELWGIQTKNLFTNEFDEKMGIIRSIFGVKSDLVNETIEETPILKLIRVFKRVDSVQAERIVKEDIRPSMKRAFRIFNRAQKDIDSLTVLLKKSIEAANNFLAEFNCEPILESDIYIGKTNTMSIKYDFETD